jgi:hypothetical protein
VDSVQLREKVGCVKDEFRQRKIFEISVVPQATEQPVHFPTNVLRMAERIASFAHCDGSELTRPRIHVLKQVPMNCPVMCNAKATVGQWLVGSLGSGDSLELL